MITEKDKYRAQFFQICGFAFMTPTVKMFLELRFMHLTDFNIAYFVFATIYVLLAILGFIFATIGITYLEERGK